MTQRRDVDTYRLTLSELLHEVCVELLDGQDMLEDLSAQRREHQEMDQAADGPNAPAVYEFAEEQIRLRLRRYRELGDRIDEIITLYNELADEALAEDDDDESDGTFSYTGDADWLEWEEAKRKSEEDDDDDDYDDNNYETDDDPDEESDRVQEWSLKKKKKDKKKDKKEKKNKKDKKEKKHKDKESKNKSEVDAKQLKKAEESSQATVTTVVENRAVKEEPTRKTAAKRSAATTKAKRKTAVKPAAKPKVASKK